MTKLQIEHNEDGFFFLLVRRPKRKKEFIPEKRKEGIDYEVSLMEDVLGCKNRQLKPKG